MYVFSILVLFILPFFLSFFLSSVALTVVGGESGVSDFHRWRFWTFPFCQPAGWLAGLLVG